METQAVNDKFDLFSTFVEVINLSGVSIERGFVIDRRLDGLRWDSVQFSSLQLLNCVYSNIKVIRSYFHRCDFVSSQFANCYFYQTNFSDCNIRKVQFTDCIFDSCRFDFSDGPDVFEETEFRNCVLINSPGNFRRYIAGDANCLTLDSLPNKAPVAEPSPAPSGEKKAEKKTEAAPVAPAGRFSHLEQA